MEKLNLYHATWEGNVPSIMEKGIVPRTPSLCEQKIDELLAEYGLTRKDIPEWIWKYPLERCKETADRVYLSGDKKYAKGNCLAGFEAEYDLRASLIAHKEKRPQRPKFEEVMGKLECKVCKLEVPVEAIHEGREALERFRKAKEALCGWHPERSDAEIEQEAYELAFRQETVDRVPPGWIKACDLKEHNATKNDT